MEIVDKVYNLLRKSIIYDKLELTYVFLNKIRVKYQKDDIVVEFVYKYDINKSLIDNIIKIQEVITSIEYKILESRCK